MTTTNIRGIPVQFPFNPYPIQRDYMEKVIECLETQKNGILESPTGTGKTLSLLCASLAWLESRQKQRTDQFMETSCTEKEDEQPNDCTPPISIPNIIYTSRTHTQLQQAMQEMKRTAYNHMKACVLGSREQMCIDAEVQEEKNPTLKINICRTKVKKRMCRFHNNVELARENEDLNDINIVDIEDIVELGKSNHFCPYYMARHLRAVSDVTFMPYNYLLDPKLKKSMEASFSNSIIIIDEAHNVEKVCEESVSVQIKSTDLETAIEDVNELIELMDSGMPLDVEDLDLMEIRFTSGRLRMLNDMLTKLKRELEIIPLVKLSIEGTVFDGDYIVQMLERAEIVEANYTGITDLLDNILEFFGLSRSAQRSGYGLKVLSNLLFVVFHKTGPEYRQKLKECFKVQIEEEKIDRFANRRFSQSFSQSFSQTVRQTCRVLNFWCFNPGFAMNILLDQDVYCVILTSGTLAPLKPLITELEIDIGVRIENPHIVKGDQVCVKILSKGPDNELLMSNFQNRNNPKYLQSLGLVISNLIRVIPDGVLIFFPSYAIMEKSIEHWQDNGIWDAINRTKPIYVEPKDKSSFHQAMVDYYSKIQDPSYSGAIFMGVCRGKVSEGLDFADINGRAVFITGLPYPPLRDPKVMLKKRYLDFRNSKDKEYLKGDDWYNLEATRAINQAIGRVIRHKDDYGAIILLDSRFANLRVKNNLSLWLRQHIVDMKNFGEIIRNVRMFFQNARQTMPQPEPKPTIVIQELMSFQASTSESNLVKVHARPSKSDIVESPPKRFR